MNSPKVLASFAHEMEAGAVVNELISRGIHAQTSGEMVAGFRAEVPGDVKILVPEEQLERARIDLAQLQSTALTDIDWSHVDVGEPMEDELVAPVERNQILIWGFVVGFGILVAGIIWAAVKP